MSLRDDLFASAPEGVTYVYTERAENRDQMRYFWHDGTWNCARLGSPHARTPADTWEALLEHGLLGVFAEELSRRFAAQYWMFWGWINELGLSLEFLKWAPSQLGTPEGDHHPILTPQQQEDRPRLALEFLKEHFRKLLEVRLVAENNFRQMQDDTPKPYIAEGQFQATPQTLEERNEARRQTPDPEDEPTETIEPIEEHEPHYEKGIPLITRRERKPSDPFGQATDTRGYPKK